MPKFSIDYSKTAQKQLLALSKNKKLLVRLMAIIDDIEADPYSPNYKFERLKHNLSGYCSKRLDSKNRIIYKVDNGLIIVIIVSVLGHYE